MSSFSKRAVPASRIPARLDLAQSVSGLILAVFMWAHLMLVSSILISKDAMNFVARMLEASFLTSDGHGYPILVSLVGVVISILFVMHAALAMRKLPANWKQLTVYREHMAMMQHGDTTAWWKQAASGFALFFLASVHLYVITTNAADIGADASSNRVYGWMGPLYLFLLFAVEVHAAIGAYRLAVKWGVFDGKDPRGNRKRLQLVKNVMTVFFLALGFASLAAYYKIGYDNAHAAPTAELSTPSTH